MSDLNDQRNPELDRPNVVNPRTRFEDLPTRRQKRWLRVAQELGGPNSDDNNIRRAAKDLYERAKEAMLGDDDEGDTVLTDRRDDSDPNEGKPGRSNAILTDREGDFDPDDGVGVLREIGYQRAGTDLTDAVKSFQRDHDLDRTGELDEPTLRALRKAKEQRK